ncbi:hypothetical protein JCM25156A_05630 [Komagataeibacter kakiaceti JCM 25156]
MALDPAFLDELRARTPIAPIIGRRTKLARSGRNWKGCCPFHGEKTPSFYVYDDHYHCFGCQAHGDVITFVMQSEGRSFPEAVEELATAAGMEMPKPDPVRREQAERARTLGDVLEAVQQSWQRRLYQPEGREGLAYLRNRGLTDETIAAFGLGWSGEGRGALVAEMAALDITPVMLRDAGVMRADENGVPQRELFFNRVTFPIRDRRGRLVSFGGRILGDGQPKYLNGPETALFSKRRVLFGLDRAREGVRGTGPAAELLVVEGYMDVIALQQAGFGGAVAPLGTALTAEQMEALWHLAPAPVLCFDGDAAGQRAAVKAAETALPLLAVDRTLRFCVLPEGEDPDSLVRRNGRESMAALVAGARPMGQVLFGLLSEGVRNPGPEQRAALRRRLVEVAALIPDKALASEYRSTLLDSFFETFRRSGPRGGSAARPVATAPVAVMDADLQRLCILSAIILEQPAVLAEVQDAYCRLELPADLAALREELLDMYDARGGLPAPDELADSLSAAGLDDVCQRVRATRGRRTRGQADDDVFGTDSRHEWWHFYALLNVERFAAEVRADTERMCAGQVDEAAWQSLRTRLLALDTLRRGGNEGDG